MIPEFWDGKSMIFTEDSKAVGKLSAIGIQHYQCQPVKA
jgi:hypothetical protein